VTEPLSALTVPPEIAAPEVVIEPSVPMVTTGAASVVKLPTVPKVTVPAELVASKLK